MSAVYTYEIVSDTNVFGAGYFLTVYLLRDGGRVKSWDFDGSLWAWQAEKRAGRKARWLREVYGAVPA